MSSPKVLALLKQRLDELVAVRAEWSGWAKVTEWYSRTRPIIAQYFPDHLQQLDGFAHPKWVSFPRVISLSGGGTDTETNLKERRANDGVAKNAKDKLVGHLGTILELASLEDCSLDPTLDKVSGATPVASSTDIFVVHGHDEEMKQHVARTVSRLRLIPIILHEAHNAGRTIIEKFEECADVSFAVVCLSPDDLAFPVGTDASKARPRARQNVVLELGYFVGKLGRHRVFSLKRGDDLELPSDIAGVAYTTYDSAGNWRFELVRELKAAGFNVDANDVI